jgi:long-chain acyl-CoA synthetase
MASAWTQHYDTGVPESLAPYPEKTLIDYAAENSKRRPDDPAILFKGTRISNADLARLSDEFALGLINAGVRRGDRIALLLPNCPQFVIAELGAWKAGATVLPLNPLYTGGELIEPLRTAGVEIIVTLTPFYSRLKEIQRETSLKQIIATSIKEYLPAVLRLLFTILKEKKGGHRISLEPGDAWFQDYVHGRIAVNPGTTPRTLPAPPGPDDPAIMLMSGGTTGTPKVVVGLHRCLVAAGVQLNVWLQPPTHAPADIALVPLPLFHVYACVGVQSHCFVSGIPMALVPNPRDIADLLKTIKQVRPTLFSAVPALFIALLNHPNVRNKSVDFSSIRACFSGAAPLMAATKTQFEQLTGGRIVEGYSLTEAMMACVVNPLNGVNKVGSVGVPLPDIEVAIVDADTGTRFLSNGETGEIILRAPQLMAGYFHNPEETARALRTHEGSPSATHKADGPWLHTGDLGYLDADSYLFIVDRQKDLIKTSGYQVWPREIEEVLATHPAVQEAGVAGVPDPVKGEVVKAWIVKRAGSDTSADELRAYCRQKIAPYKTPAHVEFRDALPKNMAGKVLRRVLVAEHKGGGTGESRN